MSTIALCEKHARGRPIKKIAMKIGKMSGINPHFLQESFDVFKEDSGCAEAVMEVELIDIKIKCKSCQKESVLDKYHFSCPVCQSTDIEIITGQEMHVDHIEIKE